MDVESFVDLVESRRSRHARFVIGVVGPPGAGKSTFVRKLERAFVPAPPVVEMDGFHLADEVLAQRGLGDRKGAPETFDAAGYVALLERIRRDEGWVVAPRFRRELELAEAGVVPVGPDDRLVLTEGNYLLLDAEPWRRVPQLLDLTAYVEVEPVLRRERLIRRHVSYGRSEEEATAWVDRSDELNAALVEATRTRADVFVRMPE